MLIVETYTILATVILSTTVQEIWEEQLFIILRETIINSSFYNNNANTGGRCGTICTVSEGSLYILDSNFTDSNVASIYNFSGGALYINNRESVNINSCNFNNDAAVLGDQNGGGIFVYQGEVYNYLQQLLY